MQGGREGGSKEVYDGLFLKYYNFSIFLFLVEEEC